MPELFTEASYENSVIELFKDMGYRYVYGPEVDRDFGSPLYETELIDALHRLNPDMPEDAIGDALFKLKNFENAELVQKNAVFMDYIQHGVEVRYFVKGEERSGLVYLVDYQHPDKNSFIVANQWTFVENSNKRPDVLLLMEIYAAREQNTLGISSAALAEQIPNSTFYPDKETLENTLRAIARPGDIILTVGAGDVYKMGENLLKN